MQAFGNHVLAVAKFVEGRGADGFRTEVSVALLAEIRRLVVSCALAVCVLLWCANVFLLRPRS